MAKIIFNNVASKIDNKTIEIPSSAISERIDSFNRIINAAIILNSVSGPSVEVSAKIDNNEWTVIDLLYPSDKVCINITQEVGNLINNQGDILQLKFSADVEFDANIDLNVEYISENIMHENNAYYDVNADKAGSGKINLATGGLNFIHNDSAASNISHVYNTWQAG